MDKKLEGPVVGIPVVRKAMHDLHLPPRLASFTSVFVWLGHRGNLDGCVYHNTKFRAAGPWKRMMGAGGCCALRTLHNNCGHSWTGVLGLGEGSLKKAAVLPITSGLLVGLDCANVGLIIEP